MQAGLQRFVAVCLSGIAEPMISGSCNLQDFAVFAWHDVFQRRGPRTFWKCSLTGRDVPRLPCEIKVPEGSAARLADSILKDRSCVHTV
jgi:hypothetical protein